MSGFADIRKKIEAESASERATNIGEVHVGPCLQQEDEGDGVYVGVQEKGDVRTQGREEFPDKAFSTNITPTPEREIKKGSVAPFACLEETRRGISSIAAKRFLYGVFSFFLP